ARPRGRGTRRGSGARGSGGSPCRKARGRWGPRLRSRRRSGREELSRGGRRDRDDLLHGAWRRERRTPRQESQPLKVLALDTASRTQSVALLDEDRTLVLLGLASARARSDGPHSPGGARGASDRVLTLVERALALSGFELRDCD